MPLGPAVAHKVERLAEELLLEALGQAFQALLRPVEVLARHGPGFLIEAEAPDVGRNAGAFLGREGTFAELLAEGFPVHIIDALRCVTKLSDNEPYDEFIERVKTNPLAVAVKINDLADNMDIRRYKELSDWDVKRLKKYLKAYHELTK